MEGKLISHYKITSELGSGGMGVVYKAEDTKLKRSVALKFISPLGIESAEDKARFIHEAQAAAALSHPNICTVHEIDEADGRFFLAMEYVEGESLKDRIARGPLKIEEALDIVLQASRGLNAAHEKGIVHRDIKPGNIMVDGSGLVKIMDFGLAKMPGRTKLTKTGTTLGTVAYMSPEQARGAEADRRSDIWSLGAVAYEMVAGRQPFKGDYEQAVLYSILNEMPEPLTALRAGVPMELERIIGKALAKDPTERYQHADELIADVRSLKKSLEGGAFSRAGVTDATPRPGVELEAKPPKRRLSTLTKVIVPVGVAAAAVIAFILLRPVLFGGAIATARRPVAVITFVNDTGDSQYDNLKKVIPNLLITSLEQSKYLQVVTWERLRDVLKQMGKENVEDIGPDLGFELCRREGIGAVVTGSFTKLGDKFVTDIKVLNVKSKDIITSANAEGRDVESIPGQVDKLSRAIARGIGLSEPEFVETQRPVIDVTTSSIEAYDWYIKGLEALDKMYYAEAGRCLTKAVELDSTFAVAYVCLGTIYGGTFSRPQAVRAYTKALTYARNATERERLLIEAQYAYSVENDSEKAILLYRKLLKNYPQEKWPYYFLGELYRKSGRFDEAVPCLEKALELDPSFGGALNDLAYVYLGKENYEKALELFRRYISLFPGDANPYDSMGETYFLMGNTDKAIVMYTKAYELRPEMGSAIKLAYICGMRGDFEDAIRWITLHINSEPLQGILANTLCWRAYLYFDMGKEEAALEDTRRAFAIADSTGNPGMRSLAKGAEALVLAGRGDYAGARATYESAVRMGEGSGSSQQPGSLAMNAFARGWLGLAAGDLAAANKNLTEMERLVPAMRELGPSNLPEMRNRLAVLGADIELAQGRPDEAIRYFKANFKPHMPAGANPSLLTINIPLDQDVLPRAYAAKGDLKKAIVEYERLLTFDPVAKDRRLKNPRYEYRLAKLFEKAGKPEMALAHYEKFLGYWKDADPDQPDLIDAKARVAALKGSPS